MLTLKRIMTLSLVGAALGFLLWSIIGQNAVSLLFGSLGGTFTCKADVEQGLRQFVQWQLYCALGGAVLLPLGAWLIRRSFSKGSSVPSNTGQPAA